jgi:hypothetical protein
MVTHMKTTIDIADALLEEAKRQAHAERRTLRDLVEEGLRTVLHESRTLTTPKIEIKPFKGRGMAPGVREGDWETIRDLIYPPVSSS